METLTHSFFVSQFREFYREIVTLKHLALTGSGRAPVTPVGEDPISTQAGGHPIWQQVVELLQGLAKKAGYGGGPCVAVAYQELQFVMVALADDVFLHLDWEGKASWQANLLEQKFFHSASAGERVFQQITHLLEDRHVGCGEMALVYVMALSLGFRGKYWGVDDHGIIETYKRDLYALAFHRAPDLVASTPHLFPEAYTHVLEDGRVKRLPDPKKWLVGLAVGVGAFVVLAHGVWLQATEKISHLIQEILTVG